MLAVCPQLSVVYLELDALPAVLTAGVITNYTTAGRPAVKKATFCYIRNVTFYKKLLLFFSLSLSINMIFCRRDVSCSSQRKRR